MTQEFTVLSPAEAMKIERDPVMRQALAVTSLLLAIVQNSDRATRGLSNHDNKMRAVKNQEYLQKNRDVIVATIETFCEMLNARHLTAPAVDGLAQQRLKAAAESARDALRELQEGIALANLPAVTRAIIEQQAIKLDEAIAAGDA